MPKEASIMEGGLESTSMAKASKYVQEMSIDGDEPPPRYILKEPANLSPPLIPIPVIDLSLLSSSSKEGLDELQKLKAALTDWGCFQAIEHGIPSSFIDKLLGVSKQFFALPVSEKIKYGRKGNDKEGYGNDPIFSDKQVLDWSDRLFLNTVPEESRKLEVWPANPSEFREILGEYTEKMKLMVQIVLKDMARSLNLGEDLFLKQHGDDVEMHARFNYYPVCPKPDSVLGLKAHSDGSMVTILLQDDEVEGLQIFKGNQWSMVPIIPHALIVILGGQMEIMSNGIFKSPLHRVLASSKKERISVAVLHFPGPEVEIGPAQQLISEERPQQYRRLKSYNAINFECAQNGQVALDTVKI